MADKKKGLLESVVDSVLHPSGEKPPEGAETATQEEADKMIKSGEAKIPPEAIVKPAKGAKKSKAAVKQPSESAPEGMQMPEGPVPGDFVERGPLKKDAKHPKDYAAGAVDKMGEVVPADDKSDEK